MLLSIEKTFSYWEPMMIPHLGRQRTEEALDLMRPILERAIAAERAGTIAFMQATIGTVNKTEAMRRGEFNLEIVFHKVIDGVWQRETERWIKQILKGTEEQNGTAQEKEGQAVQS